MRKSIVSPSAVAATPISDLWRDLERIARVEISSEDDRFPIEHALGRKETTGWRAAGKGSKPRVSVRIEKVSGSRWGRALTWG